MLFSLAITLQSGIDIIAAVSRLDPLVWLIVCTQAVNGLLYGYVMKNASNVCLLCRAKLV